MEIPYGNGYAVLDMLSVHDKIKKEKISLIKLRNPWVDARIKVGEW